MRRAAVPLIAAGIGVALGLAMTYLAPPAAREQGIEWLANPRGLAPFQLETAAGAFDNQSFAGGWTIILFGFLNCPDLCPTTLAKLAKVAVDLDRQQRRDPVRYVFVSVDPQRDSAANVARYTQNFHPAFIGATAAKADLTRLAQDLGVRFKVSSGPGEYAVAHSGTLSIIDPNGMLRGRFGPGFDPAPLYRNLVAGLIELE